MRFEIEIKLVLEGSISPGKKVEIEGLSEGFYLYQNKIVSDPPMVPIDFYGDEKLEIGIWFDDNRKIFVITILKKENFLLKVYTSKFNAKMLKDFLGSFS